jgi:hypothetical protein
MQQLPPGAAAAVGRQADLSRCRPTSLAAVNGPALCVVAGTAEAVLAFETRIGARHDGQRLETSHIHSAMGRRSSLGRGRPSRASARDSFVSNVGHLDHRRRGDISRILDPPPAAAGSFSAGARGAAGLDESLHRSGTGPRWPRWSGSGGALAQDEPCLHAPAAGDDRGSAACARRWASCGRLAWRSTGRVSSPANRRRVPLPRILRAPADRRAAHSEGRRGVAAPAGKNPDLVLVFSAGLGSRSRASCVGSLSGAPWLLFVDETGVGSCASRLRRARRSRAYAGRQASYRRLTHFRSAALRGRKSDAARGGPCGPIAAASATSGASVRRHDFAARDRVHSVLCLTRPPSSGAASRTRSS